MYSNSGISISCVERIERILQILDLALRCDVGLQTGRITYDVGL